MKTIELSKPYTMPIEEIRATAQGLADQLEDNHGVKSSWRTESVRIKGKGIDGELDFSDNVIDIKVKLGMMTSMFAPVLKKEMQRYLDKYVH